MSERQGTDLLTQSDVDTRLAALNEYDILDTPAEQGFEDVTLLAARICETPVALISLIDRDRQWFKARIGLPDCQTDLDRSVCKLVLAESDVLVIPDLALDPRTKANPSVTGEPLIRFYAGAPLRTPEGVAIGGLCVIDTKPRPAGLTEIQQESLRTLARQLTMLLDLRRKSAELTRKATATAVSESEARFRNMADYAPVMMWVTDPTGFCIYLNRRWYEFTGQTPEEADGYGWLEVTHPDDKAEAERVFLDANMRQVEFRLEYRLRRADGTYRWAIDAASPRFGSDGMFLGYVGSVTDIDEQKRAQQTLQASETHIRESSRRVQTALSAGSIIGTWNWNPAKDYFTIDEGFAHAFGHDPEYVNVGLPIDMVLANVHPEDRPGLDAAIAEAMERGGAYARQYRVRRADGKYYWIEANGRVDYGADGKPLSFPGVVIDVEERRGLEAERDRATAALRVLSDSLEQQVIERTSKLMQAEEALRQSQKMEAVGQLTGGLAHDFNNLLAGISGSLELMQTRMQQGRFNDIERYMTVAQGASKRAAALTHRLLAFSRRQTLDPKPTNVNRLVNGMQDMIQRTVGPGILVEAVGATNLWPALVDPSQLENALLNLCLNARDAMPDRGRITIETANRWMDERAARLHDMSEGQYLSMCVTDTGTGMPPEVVARAFEPFFTTKPIGEGTGLGLSMIYGFAHQSGGQVRINSEVGLGTTVCIYLPRHYGDVPLDDSNATLSVLPRSEQGETVLVVDDEPSVRMIVTDILEDLGYTAIEAGDSAAGLKVLQSNVRIDLLVSDVGLPGGMNGRQMADAARMSRPELKVLFITGYAEQAILGDGHLAPGMAVLTKPFPIETMAARIRSMIEGGKVSN